MKITEALEYIIEVGKTYGYTERMIKPFLYEITEILYKHDDLTQEVVDQVIENIL